MFTVGQQPDMVGGEEEAAREVREYRLYDLDLNRHDRQDASDVQSFKTDAEPDTPGPTDVGLNRIMDSIQALASSVVMLKVQADRGRLPASQQ